MSLLLTLLFACAPPPYVGPTEEVVVAAPHIDIMFPNPDFMLEADRQRPICPTFQLVVAVENMDVVEPGTENVEGEGHWHYFPNASDSSDYAPVYGYVLDITQPLEEGNRAIMAGLTQNDHSPLPEELQGEDEAIAELFIEDSPDCIGNRLDLSGGDDTGLDSGE